MGRTFRQKESVVTGRNWLFTDTPYAARFPPFEDESLTSWIARLANGNGLPFRSFWQSLSQESPRLRLGDLDRSDGDRLFQTLSRRTTVPEATIRALSLNEFQGKVFGENEKEKSDWIIPADALNTRKHRHGRQFCPHCLAQDRVPYFRKHWRLAFISVCPIHLVELLEACPECGGRPKLFFDAPLETTEGSVPPYLRCPTCGESLLSEKVRRETRDISTDISLFQKYLKAGADSGQFLLNSEVQISALPYFQALRRFLKDLAFGKLGEVKLKRLVAWFNGAETQISPGRQPLGNLPQTQRTSLMYSAAWFIKVQPSVFRQLIENFDVKGELPPRVAFQWYW
jgi:hypothetical protein